MHIHSVSHPVVSRPQPPRSPTMALVCLLVHANPTSHFLSSSSIFQLVTSHSPLTHSLAHSLIRAIISHIPPSCSHNTPLLFLSRICKREMARSKATARMPIQVGSKKWKKREARRLAAETKGVNPVGVNHGKQAGKKTHREKTGHPRPKAGDVSAPLS